MDERGRPPTDAQQALRNLAERLGGGLRGLRGEGETLGTIRGLAVDTLSGVLAGTAYVDKLCPRQPPDRRLPSDIRSFFLPLDMRICHPVEESRADMDDLIRRLKESERSEGQTQIHIPGEKVLETEEKWPHFLIFLSPSCQLEA